jgi:catechol 2,3-dioxygenase-like lactoylglutathione lyase family enzyme
MIDRLDHHVLTVGNLDRTRDFYVRGLGLTEQSFGNGRYALLFGQQKFNLHEASGEPIVPRAARPTPGSADFCLIADRPLDEVIELLRQRDIPVELGPVSRTGATGPIRSVYLRDPDDNLVEIAEYV